MTADGMTPAEEIETVARANNKTPANVRIWPLGKYIKARAALN